MAAGCAGGAPRTRPAVGAGIDGGFLVATGFALLFLFRSSLCPRQRAMTPRLFGGEDTLGETHSFPSLLFPRRPCPICNGSLPTCPLRLPDAPPGSPPFLFPSTYGEYEWMARVRSPYQTWRRRQNGCIPGDVPRSAGSATKWTFLIPSLRCAPPKCMTPLHGLENKKKASARTHTTPSRAIWQLAHRRVELPHKIIREVQNANRSICNPVPTANQNVQKRKESLSCCDGALI